jgi:hypothetical protein
MSEVIACATGLPETHLAGLMAWPPTTLDTWPLGGDSPLSCDSCVG